MLNKIFSEQFEAARKKLVEKGISEEDIDLKLSDIGLDLIKELSSPFLDSLIKNGKSSIREHGYIDKEFKCRLKFRWYKAFDLLEILIGCSLELIQGINDTDIEGNVKTYLLLKRLHARSIRIAKEISILMQNGYADGALARWRSLFEICATVMFIDKHGDKTAQMYDDYKQIESFNEMNEYNKRCNRLSFEPLSNTEIDEIRRKKRNLKIYILRDFVYHMVGHVVFSIMRNYHSIELLMILNLSYGSHIIKWHATQFMQDQRHCSIISDYRKGRIFF